MSSLQLHAGGARARSGGPAPRAFSAWMAAWTRLWVGSRGAPIAPQRDVAAEANAVRKLAHQLQRTDPRCAADLFAAADRHERLHG
jgi:hypothetical protein